MDPISEHEQPKPLHTLTAEEFVRRLRAQTTGKFAETRYVLFIGAGCSISSGVPGATTLIRDHWIPRLCGICAPGEPDPLTWAKRELGIDPDALPHDAYGRILTNLLPSPALRQTEFEAHCGTARPGFGYATLAQLVADPDGRFNVVLTTNFDDLIADALYLFTGGHPLVIHHGSLSPYIRATRTRPLVVKLHGHHQFAPLNTQEETQQIEPGLAAGVRSLLHDRGLIFIGYSGNDEGIRELLAELPREALPFGVYWVSGDEPAGPIRPWLEGRGATWVKHHGFDELMVHVRDVFELAMPDTNRVEDVFREVERDYVALSAQIRGQSGTGPEEIALKDAAARVDRTIRDWGVYELLAQRFKKSDPERAKATYREGLKELPDSIPLRGNFANYLKDLGELDEAEKHYLAALERDPEYPVVLHDYVIFLWRFRGDEEKAKAYFDEAIRTDPGDDAIRLSNYANFTWEVLKDVDGAEKLFHRSLLAHATGPEAFRQYAAFAHIERRDFRSANQLYKAALHHKQDDIASLVNFANLATYAGDIETARQSLERAYAVDDNDISLLGAFASFLWHHQTDLDRAQTLFELVKAKTVRGAWELRRRAMILIEYARFLALERRDEDEGWKLMEEATNPLLDDPLFVAEKASYLGHQMGRTDAALVLIDKAISSLGESAVLIGVKAGLISQGSDDSETAERLYRRALELDPKPAGFKANLAGILFARGQTTEAFPLCYDAIHSIGRSDPGFAVECFFYLFAHGPEHDHERVLGILKWIMMDGGRSKGWDLSANVARAAADGHSNAVWLPHLASVIAGEEDISVLTDWPEWIHAIPPLPKDSDGSEEEENPFLMPNRPPEDWFSDK